MNNEPKIIMMDSDEAAHLQTGLSGWVSSNGIFYGDDERAARYNGCTHRKCEDCGEPCEKGWPVCKRCREIRDIKRYEAMPKEEWDGEGGLYSDAYDKYFRDWSEVDGFCEDEGIEMKDLRLIICVPQYLPLLDSDYGCDELPEDGELPDSVIKAIDDFNKVIRATPPVSWYPGKKAAIYKIEVSK